MAEPQSADAAQALLSISVCFATSTEQHLISLQVSAGTTLEQAARSALPLLDLSQFRVGIFGKLKTPDTVLRANDRVEVYRPLQADPKESRRRRALHKG